ncbi:MAG: D-sedoheptulose 7-phosphate isomerase [Calditrichaceae bacterium]|jgi:D-sedoheptulose 7-phosphate isomerase
MNIQDKITNHLRNSARVKEEIVSFCLNDIEQVIKAIVTCFKSGNKLLICGNGGSAADAQHLAAEFVIRLSHDVERPALPAIALTTDTSQLTAGGNDIGFEKVFARQVEAYGKPADILMGISTSGNSKNIIRAFELARAKRLKTIGLLGSGGGKMKKISDTAVIIPSDNVQHIQEAHITVEHIICEWVERLLFN